MTPTLPGSHLGNVMMWIEQHEAVKMYARFFKKRYGRSAGKRARERAEELKRKGDLRGHEIWNGVARETDQPTKTPPAAYTQSKRQKQLGPTACASERPI